MKLHLWVNILNLCESHPVVELAETWLECSRKPPFLKVMAPFVWRYFSIGIFKLEQDEENKQRHVWKIADTVLEGNVWDNNHVTPITHTPRKWFCLFCWKSLFFSIFNILFRFWKSISSDSWILHWFNFQKMYGLIWFFFLKAPAYI